MFSDYGPPAPVPIYQHEEEFLDVLELYKERAPKRVLEVGSLSGGTLYHWLQNAVPGATVVSVDSHVAGADNRSHYASWCPATVTVHAIAGDSHSRECQDEVARYRPFDWIFIDADHHYDAVKADWENYRGMASPEAVILFHDILEAHPVEHPDIEVARLWDEIKTQFETREFICDPDANWGGIGAVFLDKPL